MEKTEQYALLLEQIKALLAGEEDLVARMANAAAAIHTAFKFWWTGFYRVADDPGVKVRGRELILGPFQGPVACLRIPFGKGVCGTAWEQGTTLIVPDVELFPGHIACSAASRSEIVVPLIREGKVTAVLDIDSKRLDAFDEIDAIWLEKIAGII